MPMRKMHKLELSRAAYRALKNRTSVESELKRPTLFGGSSNRFPREHVRNQAVLGKISPKAWWIIRATRVNAKRWLRRVQNRKAAYS